MIVDKMRFMMAILAAALLGVSAGSFADSGDESSDALSRSQDKDALALYEGSGKTIKNDLYSAAIQFYAAEIRVRSDFDCFPPVETGDESPMVVFGAIHAELGDEVNTQMPKDPALYARVTARLKGWDPATGPGYQPRWKYRSACGDYAKTAQEHKDKLLKPMEDMGSLLQIPEYKNAFDVEQAFNLSPYDERQKPENIKKAHDAEDAILRIEKEKGLDVLSSVILRSRKGR